MNGRRLRSRSRGSRISYKYLRICADCTVTIASLLAIYQFGLDHHSGLQSTQSGSTSTRSSVPQHRTEQPQPKRVLVREGHLVGLADDTARAAIDTQLSAVNWQELDLASCEGGCPTGEVLTEGVDSFAVRMPNGDREVRVVASTPNGQRCWPCIGQTRTHLSLFEIQRSASGWTVGRHVVSAAMFTQAYRARSIRGHVRLVVGPLAQNCGDHQRTAGRRRLPGPGSIRV